MRVGNNDQTLIVDISDALSERDRVRFTVHTRTKLPQFAKQNMSVVRQHEEFIWLHDCLDDNDQYAGYIIPPAPPKPDFEASREKLQRLGDGEASMTKEEFAKMKQELEAEYLAIFKKTVAMHEIFLQRLAAHEKFREDNNFKIFLEYENELAVRCKSKKERLAGSIQNISKSLTDFVITTSQVAATTSASSSLITGAAAAATSGGSHSPIKKQPQSSALADQSPIINGRSSDIGIGVSLGGGESKNNLQTIPEIYSTAIEQPQPQPQPEQQQQQHKQLHHNDTIAGDGNNNIGDDIDEQYFEKERLFLALYYNSIRETAIQADKVTQLQKCVADTYLHISQQLVKLAGIEVLPITAQTKDSSSFVACNLPSLTLPTSPKRSSDNININDSIASSSSGGLEDVPIDTSGLEKNMLNIDLDSRSQLSDSQDSKTLQQQQRDSILDNLYRGLPPPGASKNGCAYDHTSEGLKQLLLYVSDYLEQARKIETRIASDEDLKLTDTFLYYKRDTVAAQDLLMRRMRFLAEYETAARNLDKSRQKGRTQMQYAEVIKKQARENFISISKLAKQELIDYKQRRVASFKKAFNDLVELELKHLRSHCQLITNCLNTCRGLNSGDNKQGIDSSKRNNQLGSTSKTGTSSSPTPGSSKQEPEASLHSLTH